MNYEQGECDRCRKTTTVLVTPGYYFANRYCKDCNKKSTIKCTGCKKDIAICTEILPTHSSSKATVNIYCLECSDQFFK